MYVPVACSQCGKPFQVPEASLGKPAACPWCQAIVLGLPVGEVSSADPQTSSRSHQPASTANTAIQEEKKREELPPLEDSNPLPAPAVELLSLDDDSTPLTSQASSTKSEMRTRGYLLRIIVALFMMGAATAITLAILQRKQGHLASMEWQSFTPPDGSCSIDLLGRVIGEDSDPERGERRYISQGWYSGMSTWIGWRNLTPAQMQEGTSKDGWVQYRKMFFDKERDRLKDQFSGYISKDATIESDPVTVEVRLDGKLGPVIERMIVVLKGSQSRIYFIGMAGKRFNLEGPEVKRLFGSFRVND
jgi:hypothetical protein